MFCLSRLGDQRGAERGHGGGMVTGGVFNVFNFFLRFVAAVVVFGLSSLPWFCLILPCVGTQLYQFLVIISGV